MTSPKVVQDAVRKSRIWILFETMRPAEESVMILWSSRNTAMKTLAHRRAVPQRSTRMASQWLRLTSSAAVSYSAFWNVWFVIRKFPSWLKARTTERPVSVSAVWLTTVEVCEA